MKDNLSTKFYLRHKDGGQDTKELAKIYLRITVNRKKVELALNNLVSPKDWNETSQQSLGNKRLNELAGILSKKDDKTYTFRYDDLYYQNPAKRAISLTLPKSQQEYKSKFLFPFFFSLLSEGKNKALQCRHLQIDENYYFSLLLAIAQHDTIGAVTVKPYH